MSTTTKDTIMTHPGMTSYPDNRGGLEVRDPLWRQFANDDHSPPRGFASPAARHLVNGNGQSLYELREEVLRSYHAALRAYPDGDPVTFLSATLRRHGFDPAQVRQLVVAGCAGVPPGPRVRGSVHGGTGNGDHPPSALGPPLHELVALLPTTPPETPRGAPGPLPARTALAPAGGTSGRRMW